MPELLVSYLVSMCCQEQIGLIMSHKVPGNQWESMGIYGNSRESREFPRPSPGVGNSPPLVSIPLVLSILVCRPQIYREVPCILPCKSPSYFALLVSLFPLTPKSKICLPVGPAVQPLHTPCPVSDGPALTCGLCITRFSLELAFVC